jgi:hypothetical protein
MSPVSRRETALCPPFGGSLRQGGSVRPRPPSCAVFAGRERGPPILVPRGAQPGARESSGRLWPCSNRSDSRDRASKPRRACPQSACRRAHREGGPAAVAEISAAEPRSEKRPGAAVECESPDLVRVLVLDNRPGVARPEGAAAGSFSSRTMRPGLEPAQPQLAIRTEPRRRPEGGRPGSPPARAADRRA